MSDADDLVIRKFCHFGPDSNVFTCRTHLLGGMCSQLPSVAASSVLLATVIS